MVPEASASATVTNMSKVSPITEPQLVSRSHAHSSWRVWGFSPPAPGPRPTGVLPSSPHSGARGLLGRGTEDAEGQAYTGSPVPQPRGHHVLPAFSPLAKATTQPHPSAKRWDIWGQTECQVGTRAPAPSCSDEEGGLGRSHYTLVSLSSPVIERFPPRLWFNLQSIHAVDLESWQMPTGHGAAQRCREASR